MKLKQLFTGFFVAGLLFGGAKVVSANEFTFSVTPQLPTNQAATGLAYYDLLLNPGQSQTVYVTLTNNTSKEVTVDATLASATTNINGVVEYGKNGIKPDATLKYNLADYAKMDTKFELAPNSYQKVPVQITMPKDNYDGVIAGGLTFKQDESQTTKTATNKKGISINNEFQYVVALLLQENKTFVAPELQLNKVEPSQVNYRNVVNATYQNTAMNYLKQMAVDAKITPKGSNQTLYTMNKTAMQMAPNSNFALPLSINGAFKPGTYTYTSTVYGYQDANGQYTFGKDANGNPQHYEYRWTFSKDFTVSGQQASNLNAKDVTLSRPKSNTWIYWLIGALILIILLLLFIILWKRRKKGDDEEEKQK